MSKRYTILDENNYNQYINKKFKSIRDFEMTKINYFDNNLSFIYIENANRLSDSLVFPIKPENKIRYGDKNNYIFVGNTYHKYLSFVSCFNSIRNNIYNDFIDAKKDYINEGIRIFKIYSKNLNTKLFI